MSYTASVITVSDLGSRGLRQDTSGPAVRAMLEDAGFTVVHTAIVPDEREQISALLRACADERKIDLILTTGGTLENEDLLAWQQSIEPKSAVMIDMKLVPIYLLISDQAAKTYLQSYLESIATVPPKLPGEEQKQQ